MKDLVEYAGKRWGAIAAVLAHLPKAAKVSAQRIRDWVRRGLLVAQKIAGKGKGLLIVALDDVLAVERTTRQTTAARGGKTRGASRPKTAPTLA